MNIQVSDFDRTEGVFYSRAAASLMMVWVGIVLVVVQQTIVS